MEGFEITKIEPGNVVLCDLCNDDFTDSDESGGILFGSKAICPNCQEQWEKYAAKYNETKFITKRCPKGKSFADWVREELR